MSYDLVRGNFVGWFAASSFLVRHVRERRSKKTEAAFVYRSTNRLHFRDVQNLNIFFLCSFRSKNENAS